MTYLWRLRPPPLGPRHWFSSASRNPRLTSRGTACRIVCKRLSLCRKAFKALEKPRMSPKLSAALSRRTRRPAAVHRWPSCSTQPHATSPPNRAALQDCLAKLSPSSRQEPQSDEQRSRDSLPCLGSACTPEAPSKQRRTAASSFGRGVCSHRLHGPNPILQTLTSNAGLDVPLWQT